MLVRKGAVYIFKIIRPDLVLPHWSANKSLGDPQVAPKIKIENILM
jgi:hypothetical protein